MCVWVVVEKEKKGRRMVIYEVDPPSFCSLFSKDLLSVHSFFESKKQ